MDKSRNNEISTRDLKTGLKAIEKNDNILEKTKNQYMKRSIYSTKYCEFPMEKIEKSGSKKNLTDRKYASLNFDNFSLIKSQSTAHLPEQRNALPIIKIPKLKKEIVKCIQYAKPYFHDLFVTSKLNESASKVQNNSTALKCSIDIDNLLTKKMKNTLSKIKTTVDVSKDVSGQYYDKDKDRERYKKEWLYNDQDIPMRYKTMLSNIVYNINFKKRKQKIKVSPTLKEAFFEEILKNLSRKIMVYNQNNQFISEEEVEGFIKHEVESYFKKNRIQLTKRIDDDKSNDLAFHSKSKLTNNSIGFDYNEMNYHKQFIKNKLIKRKLNKSEDDIQSNHEDINNNKKKRKMSNQHLKKHKVSHINLVLNDDCDDSAFCDYLFLTTSPQCSVNNKYNTKKNNVIYNYHNINKDIVDKEEGIDNNNNKKPLIDEMEMTTRSFYIMQPKGLNDQCSYEKDKATTRLQFSNFKERDKDKEGILEKNSSSVFNNRNEKAKRNVLNTSKQTSLSQKTHTITKTQHDHYYQIDNCIDNIKSRLEMQKKFEIEEKEREKRRIQREEQERIEVAKLEQERLLQQKERIMRQEEEYQKYVEMKKKEAKDKQLEKVDQEKQQNKEDNNAKQERQFRNFYVVNKDNQDSLLSVLQPSKIKIRKASLNNTHARFSLKSVKENQNQTQTKLLNQKKEITPKKKASKEKLEEKRSSEHLNIKKLLMQNDEETIESKRKKEVYLLKAKQDLKYFLSNNKNQDVNRQKIQQMEEFQEKINQSIVNINNQLNSKDLTLRLDNIHEQIEDFKTKNEEEKRINAFIHALDNSLDLMKEKKKFFYTKYKIVNDNNQLAYHCATPIQK